jgi:xanthine dehydrogenase YagR molybdenum-binding subunit
LGCKGPAIRPRITGPFYEIFTGKIRNADVPVIDAAWVDEVDEHINPIWGKGIGKIGITGGTAAIANAVYHATGTRVRDLPITLDKLL